MIGAGVIGSEYASTFDALGCEVHLVDGRDALLPFLDRELSSRLQKSMERLGVRFHWKERVKACSGASRGRVLLKLASGAKLEVDAVLVAAGRRATVARLDLEAAGLAVDAKRADPGRRALPHFGAARLRRRRRRRLPGARVGQRRAGARRGLRGVRGRLQEGADAALPDRDLHDPGGEHGRPDGGGAARAGRRLRGGARRVLEQRARRDHRRPTRLPEADLPPPRPEALVGVT